MAFTSGMQALQKAIQEGKAKAAEREIDDGTRRALPGWFSFKVGNKQIIRFLTDDIITEDFYNNIICKDGITRTFLPPEGNPDLLKNYMSPSPGIGWKKEFTGEIVEPYTSRQAVGIAVKREEVLVDGKMVVRDDKTQKEFKGTKYDSLFFGIVQQAISNFWEPLVDQVVSRYGSACERDLEVVRSGAQKTTTYGFPPLIQVPELATVAAVQQRYFYGHEWNPEDPERAMKCPMTLQQWCEYISSEEYYAKWLTPKDGSAPAATTQEGGLREFAAATTSNPADEAQASPGPFATLRNNLITDK